MQKKQKPHLPTKGILIEMLKTIDPDRWTHLKYKSIVPMNSILHAGFRCQTKPFKWLKCIESLK